MNNLIIEIHHESATDKEKEILAKMNDDLIFVSDVKIEFLGRKYVGHSCDLKINSVTVNFVPAVTNPN